MADDIDISGMPDPPADLATPEVDISDMPTPADVFKQTVGRDPENDYELAQFKARPEDFGGHAPSKERQTFGSTLLGEAELGGGMVANIPHGAAHAVVDLSRRLTGGDTNAPDPDIVNALQVPEGAAAKKLTSDVSSVLPRAFDNGLDVSDEELRAELDPSGTMPIEKLREMYRRESSKSTARMLQESGTTAGDVVGGGLNVGQDVANIVPAVQLTRSAGMLASHLASGAKMAGTIKNFGQGPVEAAPEPTAPTPAIEGPVTGESLRAQPDPLAPAAPAAEAATPAVAPPEANAAPGASQRVPGKPHIRLKAAAMGEPTAAVAPEPAATPETPRFTPPTAEGATAGPAEPETQASRLNTIRNLNQLAGGTLDEVRTSAISGDTKEAGVDYTHSKPNDAAGQRMQGVIANETNALRQASSNLVDRTGTVEDGVDQPTLRQRGAIVSKAISGIEDWFDNNIKNVYETAKQRARGIPIQSMQNFSVLAGDESQFAGTMEGEALYRGVQSRARKLGLIGSDGAFKPATVEQAEQMRQGLGEMWTPRTGAVIGRLKDSLDADVAQHGGADLFAQARALRAQKGKMLEDPTGIAQLLHPEDRLGINRAVPLEQVPDYVANLDTDQFNHVINVLKSSAHLGGGELADDAAAAIREIKGHMAARIHDAGSAKIQGGWDAKSLYRQLNNYSTKMPAVFSPREMSDWKTLNDASNALRMDRTYKGAVVEAHNVGLMGRAREKAGTLARGAIDVGAHHVAPGVGPALAEITGLSEKVGKFVGGDAEKAALARRLADVEGRLTKLAPEAEPTPTGPTLGQRIGGARQRGGPKFENNASGESSASLEAQNRVAQEKAAGQHRYMVDSDGNVTPLTGVDAVDQKAPAGSIIIQRGVGATPYSVLDRGGMNAREAQGLLARAQGLGKLKEAEQAASRPLGDRIYGGKQRGGPKLTASDEKPTVNIGLKIGDKVALTPDQVEKVLKSQGAKITKRTVHESTTEPTVVATLDKPLTPKQANTVSALLKQDAIAQVHKGVGQLYGPKAAEWGPFNRDYFLTHKGEPLSANDPLEFRHFSNLSDKSITLDPARYGEGLKGAERMRVMAGAPKVTSAYAVGGEVEPELRNKTQYSVKVPKRDMYDLSSDPAGIKQAVMDDNGGVYDHTEAEHAIKKAGYKGYYLPNGQGIFKGQARFFEKMAAERVTPEQPLGARIAGGRQRGAVGNLNKKPALPTEHLTDSEQAQLRSDTSQRLIDAFHNLPPEEEYAAAALAGKAKKGWYENSARAIANTFGPDAPRFSALLASMSPQTSVQMNFHNALRTFINWDKAGRPTDSGAIRRIMEKSSLNSGKSRSNVLPAWVGNSVRALTSPDPETLQLSGPKVHSFMRNLQNDTNEVTNDAWMAAFAKMDPAAIGGKGGVPGNKRPAYMAMSAKVRAAAKLLTKMTGESWTPSEVQETVWSWAKTSSEHADSYGGLATIPELVKDGEITDELIKATPDFHQLFNSPEHSAVIRNSRLTQNANGVASQQVSAPVASGTGQKTQAAERTLKPHLEAAAKRLEQVRLSKQPGAE